MNPREQVLSEVALCELLNIEQHTLNRLRLEKGMPYVRLDARNRAYLVDDVMEWLRVCRRSISD